MKNLTNLLLSFLLLLFFSCQTKIQNNPEILSLYPENPNYFLFQGKPTILLTSGEHYGSVMNTAFDYKKYLNTIKQEGFNYTRIFIGPYSEIGGNNFGIIHNTMNPEPANWLVPWLRESASGKYDLTKWNDVFFKRLKAFISMAVEVSLFTSYYTNHQWRKSPFNPKNNIQGFDSISFKQVNTINNRQLMQIQENYVQKVVQELNVYENVFFEIQNEPWADNGQLAEKIAETDTISHPSPWQRIVETAKSESLEWQKRMAQIVADEESQLPNKHLIAQNISNFRYQLTNPNPNVSIFNFHYAYPEAAAQNLGLKKAIALDETGFMPHTDFNYRSQAWKFILAGGALYNNLDYSFTVGAEGGTSAIDAGTPGWGGVAYRKQLRILKDFIEGFDFTKMKPDNSILKNSIGNISGFQVFAETGKQYAIYFEKANSGEYILQIPNGNYSSEYVNPITGNVVKSDEIKVDKGSATMVFTENEDIAIRLLRK
jgi:hypothetical protein